VFTEESFPEPLLRVLDQSAGARVYIISHIATGPYSAEKFEQEMQKNVQAMIKALVTDG
jgi:zinc transport system substrate-binding protein